MSVESIETLEFQISSLEKSLELPQTGIQRNRAEQILAGLRDRLEQERKAETRRKANPYNRTTPQFTGALDNAQANPIQFSSPGQGNAAPNAGQPISVTGGAGSTANPAVDVGRKVAGQVPGTNVVVNLPG
jgi:hypothetical protein